MNALQFQPSVGSNGTDQFPKSSTYVVKSGFVKDIPQTLPPTHQVHTACYDPSYTTQSKSSRSLLYHLRNKDPIEKENEYYGPGLMSTENKTRFIGYDDTRMDTSSRIVGPKEGSGFTHAYNNEPITNRPNDCFDEKNTCNQRMTGKSIMKCSFQPSENANGKENFKLLSKRAERQTGYTREKKPRPEYACHQLETYTKLSDVHPLRQKEIKKNDQGEYFNYLYAKPYPSMTTAAFKGLQSDPKTKKAIEKGLIGSRKEETGFTENNCKFVESAETNESLKRFETHYKLRFGDKNLKMDQILSKKPNLMTLSSNGFMKSTKVHSHGNPNDVCKRHLHPYVARSIRLRDPSSDM